MSLVYYVEDGAGYAGSVSLPSYETVSLLRALYLKKEAFRKTAKRIITFEDITVEGEKWKNNSVTIRLGSESYFCNEHTYYNSLLYDFENLDYYGKEEFAKKHSKLSLEKYKSYSRPLADTESDGGPDRGYRGYDLNFLECLIKFISDLPDYTLIESNSRVDDLFASLFRFHGDRTPELHMSIDRYSINGYDAAEEYEVYQELINKIQDLCKKKNIYFDINPYSKILMFKEPVETWVNTNDSSYSKGARYNYTKYEDAYIDGHTGSHEESSPVEIIEKTVASRKSRHINRKYYTDITTYNVTYADGVKGQITTEHDESYD